MSFERASFVGYKIPDEIKPMTLLIGKDLERNFFKEILNTVLDGLEGKEVDASKISSSRLDGVISERDLHVIILGLHRLLVLAIRKNIKSSEVVLEDLIEMKIPIEFSQDIVDELYGPRKEKLMHHARQSGPSLNTLSNLRWRIDVDISNSSLSRVLGPSISMQITLDNGDVKSFEVPLTLFHELRHDIATALKDMSEIEESRFLQIQD